MTEYKKNVMMEIQYREMGVLLVKKNDEDDLMDEEEHHQSVRIVGMELLIFESFVMSDQKTEIITLFVRGIAK